MTGSAARNTYHLIISLSLLGELGHVHLCKGRHRPDSLTMSFASAAGALIPQRRQARPQIPTTHLPADTHARLPVRTRHCGCLRLLVAVPLQSAVSPARALCQASRGQVAPPPAGKPLFLYPINAEDVLRSAPAHAHAPSFTQR